LNVDIFVDVSGLHANSNLVRLAIEIKAHCETIAPATAPTRHAPPDTPHTTAGTQND
jgi:hypothetical protein